jgi:hypothetical protein
LGGNKETGRGRGGTPRAPVFGSTASSIPFGEFPGIREKNREFQKPDRAPLAFEPIGIGFFRDSAPATKDKNRENQGIIHLYTERWWVCRNG